MSRTFSTITWGLALVVGAVASFLLAACGQAAPGPSAPSAAPTTSASASSVPPSTPSAAPTTSASASSVPAGVTLLKTCPQVESALVEMSGTWTGKQWGAAREQVQILSDAGDLETKNALRGVLAGMETMQSEPQGVAFLDAEEANDRALSNFNARCRTVGSSAGQ